MQETSMRVAVVGGVRKDVTIKVEPGFDPLCGKKITIPHYEEDFGGSAARAAMILAGLGARVSLVAKGADDVAGEIFSRVTVEMGIQYHRVPTPQFPASVALVSGGVRTGLLYNHPDDDDLQTGMPTFPLEGFDALYIDGRLPNAALAYAREAHKANVPVLLDGCAGRENTTDLLALADVAIVSEALCEEHGLRPPQMLEALQAYQCSVGAVTMGQFGTVWYDARGGNTVRHTPAHVVPQIVNTNGAGDVFHAVFLWAMLTYPKAGTEEHMRLATAGAAHAIMHLESEARRPTQRDIEKAASMPCSNQRPSWWRNE
jgi:sulfofructose kinase